MANVRNLLSLILIVILVLPSVTMSVPFVNPITTAYGQKNGNTTDDPNDLIPPMDSSHTSQLKRTSDSPGNGAKPFFKGTINLKALPGPPFPKVKEGVVHEHEEGIPPREVDPNILKELSKNKSKQAIPLINPNRNTSNQNPNFINKPTSTRSSSPFLLPSLAPNTQKFSFTQNTVSVTAAATLPNNMITQFDGISGSVGGVSGATNPPDVVVAAGPNTVVEMVNRLVRVSDRAGNELETKSLLHFFKETDGVNLFDPNIVYDAESQRFFATFSSTNLPGIGGGVDLAVSHTADPSGDWDLWRLPFDGGCADYDTLGYSSDKVAVSVNNFATGDCTGILGAQYYIITKANLLQGNINSWEQSTTNPNDSTLLPVRSNSPTTTLRMVEVDTNDPHVYLTSFTGSVPNAISSSTLQNVPLSFVPECCVGASQPNSDDPSILGPEIDTGTDNRVLTASWYQGGLWLSFNDKFTYLDGQGNIVVVRSGFRIVGINTANSIRIADLPFTQSDFEEFYPALNIDKNNNIDFVFGFSSEEVYPSLIAWTMSANSPGVIDSESLLANGQSSSVAFVNGGDRNRYGDYFGAAVDPVDSSQIWVAGEYHVFSGGEEYSTNIAAITAILPGGGNIPQNAVWSAWLPLSKPPGHIVTSKPVVAQNADGRLEAFVRGDDNALYHRVQSNPGSKDYTPYASLGGFLTSDPAVALNANGRLEVFARGAFGLVYHNLQSSPGSANYVGWSRLIIPFPGVFGVNIPITGTPAVAKNSDGRLEIFVRDARCGFFCILGNFVFHTEQLSPNNSALYYPWLQVGNQRVGSDPIVSQNVDGRLEVLARSGTFLTSLVHNSQTSPSSFFSYTGWTSLGRPTGTSIVSNPAVGRNLDGRLEVLARGSDGFVYHTSQLAPGSAIYTGWSRLGGEQKAGNPAVAQDADGKLRVFMHGLNDNILYEKIQIAPNSNTYSDWMPLGGNLKPSLDHAVAKNTDGRLELFAVFDNNELYHKYQLSLQPPGNVN